MGINCCSNGHIDDSREKERKGKLFKEMKAKYKMKVHQIAHHGKGETKSTITLSMGSTFMGISDIHIESKGGGGWR